MPPGKIALFGSGETAPAGQRVHEALFRELDHPIHAAVLETPAGFQPNTAWVAGRLAEFLEQHLQNYHPQVTVVPARRRDGAYSTDDPDVAAPLLAANYVFAGPGSPSYFAHHMAGTWAWHVIVARQRRGATLALASAAAIATGAFALPVYEIFKAGTDLHWLPGLDLFGPYGLSLAVITHWDNQEGGAHLDTSRAFVGKERMARLLAMLPPSTKVLGVDEHTGVILDLAEGTADVIGRGTVTVCRAGEEHRFGDGEHFPLTLLGDVRLPTADEGLRADVLEAILSTEQTANTLAPRVKALIEEREAARRNRDWARADALRAQAAELGYAIEDTADGPRWRQIP